MGGGATLEPGTGGILEVYADDDLVWSRMADGGLPDIVALKRRVGRTQATAAATSSATFFSTAGVHASTAKPVAQKSPSSRRAGSSKLMVA